MNMLTKYCIKCATIRIFFIIKKLEFHFQQLVPILKRSKFTNNTLLTNKENITVRQCILSAHPESFLIIQKSHKNRQHVRNTQDLYMKQKINYSILTNVSTQYCIRCTTIRISILTPVHMASHCPNSQYIILSSPKGFLPEKKVTFSQ